MQKDREKVTHVHSSTRGDGNADAQVRAELGKCAVVPPWPSLLRSSHENRPKNTDVDASLGLLGDL